MKKFRKPAEAVFEKYPVTITVIKENEMVKIKIDKAEQGHQMDPIERQSISFDLTPEEALELSSELMLMKRVEPNIHHRD